MRRQAWPGCAPGLRQSGHAQRTGTLRSFPSLPQHPQCSSPSQRKRTTTLTSRSPHLQLRAAWPPPTGEWSKAGRHAIGSSLLSTRTRAHAQSQPEPAHFAGTRCAAAAATLELSLAPPRTWHLQHQELLPFIPLLSPGSACHEWCSSSSTPTHCRYYKPQPMTPGAAGPTAEGAIGTGP